MKKVVTAQEMARIEKWAQEKGADLSLFMLEAGKQAAIAAQEMVSPGSKIVLLIGKGNKGGDAYVAGIHLRRNGYRVKAITIASPAECSELNRRFSAEFGKGDEFDFIDADLIIDGLLGTGFHGSEVTGPIAAEIDRANNSKKPILAIDLPSGLNAHPVIHATVTITLGLPKMGLFLRDGWNATGKLRIVDFGLPNDAVEEAKPVAWVPELSELKLPPIIRTQHKYQRGCAVGLGGSAALKGAIKLSGSAALHTGAGIVKIFTLEEIGPALDELICQIWDASAWKEAAGKASAFFIGPGLGRSKAAKNLCKAVLHEIDRPCVLDADALYFLPELNIFPKQSILTPHRGEMLHLLGLDKIEEEELHARCQTYAQEKQVILILKGAPTTIFSTQSLPVIVPYGDPGMATAGSGDVLTGILAALLAQGQEPFKAAVLGVVLHDLAGEAAAGDKTSYGFTASDLIANLPKALLKFTT